MGRAASRGAAPADRPPASAARARSRRLHAWIPPQHGVWAMLLLPYLAGLRFGLDPWQIPLLVGWLTGWLCSYYALLAVKTRRLARVRRQVIVYGACSAASLLPVLATHPALAWFAPAFAVLLTVDATLTRIGQERSTGNGIVSVTMASLMGMIVPATAGLDWRLGMPVAAVTWLYLAGSVLYVKSMIREHGSRPHRLASAAFHALALVVAAWISPWLAVPFSIALARAVVLPRQPRMRAPAIGAIEVAVSLVMLGFLLAVPLPG